ncbi:MAG: hypothetical protein ACYDHU_04485 [Acidimicrobiales bacterium]
MRDHFSTGTRVGSLGAFLRFVAAGTVLVGAAIAFDAATVVAAGAATSTSFAVANGFASYTPSGVLPKTTVPAPVTFSVAGLATGGSADSATLKITVQPASGTATATGGVVRYTPTSGTTGTQTVGFSICTAPSTNCRTATITFGPARAVNDAFKVPLLGGYSHRVFYYGAQAPAAVVPGSTFTESVAQPGQVIPSSLALTAFKATINYVNDLTAIMPVPANATYVAGSARLIGGTAVTAGKATVTYCTAFGTFKPTTGTKHCTATKPSATFPTATTTPYLEEQLTPTVHVPGGSNLTMPTLVAEFTASGPNGSAVQPVVTESDLGVNVTVVGLISNFGVSLTTYPTNPSFTTAKKVATPSTSTKKITPPAPPYFAYPLANTAVTTNGYWEVASDGGIFSFGAAQFYGSMGGQPLNAPVVGMASTPDRLGYWEVASDGGIFSYGDATFYGSMGGQPLNAPVVGMAVTPTGKGYWEVASDGGIFSFGAAQFYGSMGGQSLSSPVVGMAATPTGKGYWEVASDGGIFSFGAARYQGSMGGQSLSSTMVGMDPTPSGRGYWLAAADGGIFSFGTATSLGSMGGQPLNAPVVGMATTPSGLGYWEVAADGGIFSFGDAPFYGSMGGQPLNAPVVGMASSSPMLPR